jgi:hypothetical protein
LKISIRSNNNHTIHEIDKNQRELIESLDLQYPFYVETGNVRKAQLAKDRSIGKNPLPKIWGLAGGG